MAGSQKTKRSRAKAASKKNAFDIEAIGLVLLALGIFMLGLLIPQLPKGDWGEQLRLSLITQLGWGAFTLPWPFIVYGGVLTLGLTPKHIISRSLGYFTFMLGSWCFVMLAKPGSSGVLGEQMRAALFGFTGWLGYLIALFVISVGVDIFMRWPLTYTTRGLTKRVVHFLNVVRARALETRRVWKVRAAFHADLALIRNDLSELNKDLQALNTLYPGSAEVSKWRKAVSSHQVKLKKPTPEKLSEAQLQTDAWENAISDFTHLRAEELKRQLSTEGLESILYVANSVKAQLDDPLTEELEMSKALNDVRQALSLDLVAMQERNNDLGRERDRAIPHLIELNARELVIASQKHQKRLKDYQKLATDLNRLEKESNLLEHWRDIANRLDALLAEFPTSEDFLELDTLITKEARRTGRKILLELDSWEKTLVNAERSTRAGRPKGIDLEDPWQDHSLLEFEKDGSERNLDMPPVNVELLQKPLPSMSHNAPLPEDAEQEKLFPYSMDLLIEPEDQVENLPDFGGIPIQLPSFDLLDEKEALQEDPAELAREVQLRVKKIDETLANFKLDGRVVASVRGPAVTRFEVEPSPGEKISRFANLSDDLALAMAVGSVRIEAPIPGKSVIGLEVPNANRDLIRFREAASSAAFRRNKARLPIILGKSIDGDMQIGDLARMPHMLIAGSTGSGKSVAVNTVISSLLYKFLPTELRFLMIDPKMVELTPYDGIPHLLQPVVTNPNDAGGVLLGAVAHMERRYKMMSKVGAKNIDQYNEKARNQDMPEMPIIIIIIDELADLMITSRKDVEGSIMRLAQMARATGMHLVIATQRPSVDILTALIKVNVPARMAFAVSSSHDSRTILDAMGAERLIGSGDMLYSQPGMVKPMRLQGPFITETELVSLANFLRRQYFDDDFVEAYGSDFDPPSLHESDASGFIDWDDDKLRIAAELVINEGQASVSRLQRRLQVGHARAGKLMDSLEALSVVGPHMGSKPRDVLVAFDELPNIFGK